MMSAETQDLEFSWKFVNETDADDVLSSSSSSSETGEPDIMGTPFQKYVRDVNANTKELSAATKKEPSVVVESSKFPKSDLKTNKYVLIFCGIGVTVLLESLLIFYLVYFQNYNFSKNDLNSQLGVQNNGLQKFVEFMKGNNNPEYQNTYLQQQLSKFNTGKFYIDFEKNIVIPLKNSTKLWFLNNKMEHFNNMSKIKDYESLFEYDFQKDINEIIQLIYQDINLLWMITRDSINHSNWFNNTLLLVTNISTQLENWKLNLISKLNYQYNKSI